MGSPRPVSLAALAGRLLLLALAVLGDKPSNYIATSCCQSFQTVTERHICRVIKYDRVATCGNRKPALLFHTSLSKFCVDPSNSIVKKIQNFIDDKRKCKRKAKMPSAGARVGSPPIGGSTSTAKIHVTKETATKIAQSSYPSPTDLPNMVGHSIAPTTTDLPNMVGHSIAPTTTDLPNMVDHSIAPSNDLPNMVGHFIAPSTTDLPNMVGHSIAPSIDLPNMVGHSIDPSTTDLPNMDDHSIDPSTTDFPNIAGRSTQDLRATALPSVEGHSTTALPKMAAHSTDVPSSTVQEKKESPGLAPKSGGGGTLAPHRQVPLDDESPATGPALGNALAATAAVMCGAMVAILVYSKLRRRGNRGEVKANENEFPTESFPLV